ncbi:MAG: hypothetical protein HYU27_00955 [Acidobacteria bacterium]|nr:hypothetical protein [Acidobacteriota bacterium]
MKYRVLLFLAAAALLCGATAYAHHSFGATYNSKSEIKIEGKLMQFVFRNPHSFVHIEAPDPNGVMQRWSVEWSGAAALGNQGLSQKTLKAGDHVVITGRRSRAPGEYRVQMLTLKRPADGFSWGNRTGEVVD